MAAALKQAVAILPAGSSLRAHLEQDLEQSASRLLRELQRGAGAEAEHQGEKKPAKRAKKSSKGAPAATLAAGEGAAAGEAAAGQDAAATGATGEAGASTLLDRDLDQAVSAVMSAAQPSLEAAFPLLLARQPPPDPLLSWFMRQLQQRKVEEAGSEAEGLLQAAACALVVCRSLAGFAASIEGALACYEPAVSQLVDLAARLVEPAGAGGATAASIGGPPSGAARQRQVQELTALTDRTMVCLQLELLHQRLAASTLWQHWQGPAASRGVADVPSRASSTCAALVSLRLQLLARARGGAPSRQQRELLTAQAAYDLRQLAPHALAGQLARLASAPVEELAADASILALYSAMVQQGGWVQTCLEALVGADWWMHLLLWHLVQSCSGAWSSLLVHHGAMMHPLPRSPSCRGWPARAVLHSPAGGAQGGCRRRGAEARDGGGEGPRWCRPDTLPGRGGRLAQGPATQRRGHSSPGGGAAGPAGAQQTPGA